MAISILVAVAENDVIGNKNSLIWHFPADLKRFKALTTGHCIIMGRKTFDSIGKPLPNRTTIIVSRKENLNIEGCFVVNSIEKAIEKARELSNLDIFIVGGESIYKQSISFVDRIYLTKIHQEYEGDTCFESSLLENFECKDIEHFPKDEKHEAPYSFLVFEKKF